MMPRTICVSMTVYFEQIKEILLQDKKRWQTASLIGCQMVISPDATYRVAVQKGRKKPLSAGSSISGSLNNMVQQNIIDRRRNEEKNRWEYRLKQK